jgi:hypothetical protein
LSRFEATLAGWDGPDRKATVTWHLNEDLTDQKRSWVTELPTMRT